MKKPTTVTGKQKTVGKKPPPKSSNNKIFIALAVVGVIALLVFLGGKKGDVKASKSQSPAANIAQAKTLFKQATDSAGGERNNLYKQVVELCREVANDERASEGQKQEANGLRYSANKLTTN